MGMASSFVLTYLLFSLSGFLFRLDRAWYDKLEKPRWTPVGGVIALIWLVLYGCISLATAWVFEGFTWNEIWLLPLAWLGVNWFVNQSFTYWMFRRKDLWAAYYTALATFLTAIGLAGCYLMIDVWASLLLVPYIIWTAIASRLAWLIASKNPARTV
jgi:tryptophan-rich sensory protein